MTVEPRRFGSFEKAFATAFLEEIAGESYFWALSQAEPDPRRSAVWARLALVERRTTAALRPARSALGITPADELAAWQSGADEASGLEGLSWDEAMSLMLRDYPVYLDEFTALKLAAPDAAAAAAAQILIDHEVAIIDMARAELAGDPHSGASLDRYLARLPA